KNCHSFLFPSVFEGFGMPPVEAMLFGTKVITTKCTSIPEVTQNKALYVEDPYRVDDWVKMIRSKEEMGRLDVGVYAPDKIAKEYLDVLYNS
ncbi:glycosyltransferase, partial [Holdemanella sp.]|uniref:glycosyltransferase n=1 Tax=Holdemanella sp. TaxID=1971762 RepID=UPI003AF10AD6